MNTKTIPLLYGVDEADRHNFAPVIEQMCHSVIAIIFHDRVDVPALAVAHALATIRTHGFLWQIASASQQFAVIPLPAQTGGNHLAALGYMPGNYHAHPLAEAAMQEALLTSSATDDELSLQHDVVHFEFAQFHLKGSIWRAYSTTATQRQPPLCSHLHHRHYVEAIGPVCR